MDSANSNPVEREDSFYILLSPAQCCEETCFDMARSEESWSKHDADSERFQRYESRRKKSAKNKEQWLGAYQI
jgi:hypothetical protein